MGRTVGPVRVGGPVRASRIRPNTIFILADSEGYKRIEGVL